MADFKNGLYVNPSDNDFKSVVNGTDIPSAVKGRIIKAASADISHLSQQYFNPFTQVSTMEIPKDRRKINAYCRYFFESEPLVHAALTLHTEFPLSSIYIRHEDPEIQEFLEYMVDELDLFEFMMNAALEYWVIGEFCLVPDTMITMGDRSQKPISEIKVGDQVATHRQVSCKVLHTMVRPVNEDIFQIYVKGSRKPLEVTGNHPIRVYDKNKVSWRNADKLAVNDLLSNGVITRIDKKPYEGLVYNLEVEEDHSYVANDTVVHNCAFGIFDDPDDPQMWEKFILLDPDYVDVYSVPMARGKHSVRMNLLPNPMLKRIVENGPADPNTGELFAQIPSDVIAYVRQNIPMPLDPTCASYTKILGNPHNERATPLLMSTMKLLMYRDKLRSAQYAIADRHVTPKEFYMIGEPGDPASQEEIDAFKEILMSTWTQPNQAIIYHHALKVQWEGCHGEGTQCLTKSGFKTYDQLTTDDEIATFNPKTGYLEYQKPIDILVYDHDGDLLHFDAYCNNNGWQSKIDVEVTPNHRMMVKDGDNWVAKYANECADSEIFRLDVKWDGIRESEFVDIGEHKIPLHDYLELAGYFVSEGSSYVKKSGRSARFYISQNENSPLYNKIKQLMERLPFKWSIYRSKPNKNGNICARFICNYYELVMKLRDEFGHIWHEKRVPEWIKNLPSDDMMVFIKSAQAGDGSKKRNSNTYWTTSSQLRDDMQEMVWKCGYIPTTKTYTGEQKGGRDGFANRKDCYVVTWTDQPELVSRPIAGKPELVSYTGKVWCVTVPNGFFVTRNNGKLAIHGNSQGRILPLQAEFDDIEKHVLAGLMTSRAFLHGEGPTYASSSIALDVLIQRYLFFRRKMEQWLIRSVFRPIMELHGMYKPEQSELNNRYRIKKRRVPWDPEIQWEKQNLRDDNAKAQLLMALYDKGLIPADHLLKFHNIDPDIAARGIEKERGTVFDKNAKGGMPGPGGMPPMPPGGGMDLPPDMNGIAPNAGGLEMPPGGFGGVDMGEIPVEGANPVIPEVSKAPVDLPSAL